MGSVFSCSFLVSLASSSLIRERCWQLWELLDARDHLLTLLGGVDGSGDRVILVL